MAPTLSLDTNFAGVDFHTDIYHTKNFSGLTPLKQSYALAFDNDNKLLLVINKNDYCMLPGGSIEPGENPIETLVRELYEEAAVKILEDSIEPAFYQSVTKFVNNEKIFRGYELRYFCRISQKDQFIADPCDGNIVKQIYCTIDELPQYLLWGKTTPFIQEICKEYLSAHNS